MRHSPGPLCYMVFLVISRSHRPFTFRDHHGQHDSAVFLAPFFRIVFSDRFFRTEADVVNLIYRDSLLDDEIMPHGINPALAEVQVVVFVSDGIRPAFEHNDGIGALHQRARNLVESIGVLLTESGAVELELDGFFSGRIELVPVLEPAIQGSHAARSTIRRALSLRSSTLSLPSVLVGALDISLQT